MITAFIIGCEIGFWVLVLAGLVCRYVLRMKPLGAALLIATPVVDVVLLLATAIDLDRGATAGSVHGLAAIYVGVSVAYGHKMVRWADVRFAHRYAGGPAPAPRPKYGAEHAAYERRMWLHHLSAWAIGCLLLLGMIRFVGDAARTESLSDTIRLWSIVLFVDFLYSHSFSFWPRKAKPSAEG